MNRSDKPKQSPHTSYEVVEEQAVIIDLNSGSYYSLNDTGTMFWKLLDGQRTIAECAVEIAKEYDVEAGVVEPDILELAAEFEAEGLIQR